MSENPQVKKDSPDWQEFLKNLWEDYGHPKDDKEPTIKSWRSWEKEEHVEEVSS